MRAKALPALLFAICLLVSAGPAAAAAPKIPTRDTTTVARLRSSDPGYLQYLESKSLLGSSRELARIVSGSQIMWHAPATDPTPEQLLKVAATWLEVHPIPLLTRRDDPVFGHLAGPVFSNILRQLGVEGLYIAPSSGTGALWRSAINRVTDWEGMVQLAFTDSVGDDRDYGLLLGRANQSGFFLGMEMTQAATGLGPDFFLGARGNPEFQRLYRMLEIPSKLWTDLPQSKEEWDCTALSAEQVKKLVAEKTLPAGEDVKTGCGAPWGWAVTGPVPAGEQGKFKRFAYRYYLHPLRPIMDWEDPKAGARRILSACAIRRIGTQGAALLGMQTRALHGLNPGAKPGGMHLEPALSAALSIGREVRRYGAWTWLEDELSLPQLQAFLRHGPDFARDTVSSPGAEHALLTGNAELVRFMYDEARRTGLDQRRLARRLPDERGLSYALPHLCALDKPPFTPAQIREQARSKGAWAGTTLYAGSSGLAALALNGDASSPAARAAIRQGQTLLLFFKAMQPGLFMLPARDLRGTLPLDGQQGRRPPPGNEPMLAMHGAYNLLSTADDAPAGKDGLPRAATLYPPLDVQEMRPAENFLRSVREILRLRKQTGIAEGRFVTRLPTKNTGCIALLFALPGKQGAVLTVCNFSRADIQESFSLGSSEIQAFARGGVRHLWGAGADASSVTLGAWQGTAFLLGKMPGTAAPPQATPGSAPDTAAPESPHAPGVQGLEKGETSHVIQPGEQLSAIAARHHVSPEAILTRNNIPSPDLAVEGRTLIIPAPAAGEEIRHMVQSGDTLIGIAVRYKVRPDAIMLRNNLSSPDRVTLGRMLIIPASDAAPPIPQQAAAPSPPSAPEGARTDKAQPEGEQQHLVQSGDSLHRIAAQYGVKPGAIMQRNKLASPDRVLLGQTLIIPAPGAAPALQQQDPVPGVQQAAAQALPQQATAPTSPARPLPPPAPDTARTEKGGPVSEGEQQHLVQSGDSLHRIAARYGVKPGAIMQRNKLASPDRVILGQTLIIPAPDAAPAVQQQAAAPAIPQQAAAPTSPARPLPPPAPDTARTEKGSPVSEGEQQHLVQSGDSLHRIAARYKVRPDAIMQRNKLASPDRIILGQMLIIPAPDAAPAVQQAAPAIPQQAAAAPPKVRQEAASSAQAPQAAPDAAKTEERASQRLQKGEQRHMVQSGDTLGRIAAQYGVKPDAIMQRNKLASPDRVLLGMPLIIPAPAR